MERDALIKLLASKAIGYLNYDDANPNVGWGMSISSAIELAEQATLEEAARWNSIEALRLNFTDELREAVSKIVYKERMS